MELIFNVLSQNSYNVNIISENKGIRTACNKIHESKIYYNKQKRLNKNIKNPLYMKEKNNSQS